MRLLTYYCDAYAVNDAHTRARNCYTGVWRDIEYAGDIDGYSIFRVYYNDRDTWFGTVEIAEPLPQSTLDWAYALPANWWEQRSTTLATWLYRHQQKWVAT